MHQINQIVLFLALLFIINGVSSFTIREGFNETFTGRCTWYDVSVGLTACGSQHGDDELVFALNVAQFDPYTPHENPNLNTLCGKVRFITSSIPSRVRKS